MRSSLSDIYEVAHAGMVLSGLPSRIFKGNMHENLIFEKIEKI